MTEFNRRRFMKASLATPFVLAAAGANAASHVNTHQVSIEGFAFVPADLNVTVGDLVVFTNKDSAPHTATAPGFETGRLRRGDAVGVTISSAGEHDYICKFHPNMKGVIRAG